MNNAPRPRQPAVAGQPVVDPAGWAPDELVAGGDWVHMLKADDIAEIDAAVAHLTAQDIALADITAAQFPLPRLAKRIEEIRRQLQDGRGIVVLRGLPVGEKGREWSARAYLGLGAHLGRPVSQNAYGHLLGHVRDFGKSYDDPRFRGYQSSAALGFHCDHCDYVGLMCMETPQSGGESRVASAVTLYNRLLAADAGLAAELCRDFYWTRHGEVPAGQPPYYTQPVFSFYQGYFSARGVSSYIRKAQGLSGVPAFTPAQEAAMKLYVDMVEDCAADIPFAVGDIQLLHNHVLLHSRRAFVDRPAPAPRRHLYRLWLKEANPRPLPDEVRANFQGVYVAGTRHQVVIDPEAAEEAAA